MENSHAQTTQWLVNETCLCECVNNDYGGSWCLVCFYTKNFLLLQKEMRDSCVTSETRHRWGKSASCDMIAQLGRTMKDDASVDFWRLKWNRHSGTAQWREPTAVLDFGRSVFLTDDNKYYILIFVAFPTTAQVASLFFFRFVWIQSCRFLTDEMQRTNKANLPQKDWPSSADTVMRSSHVEIIFCSEGDVLIKHLFITRSVPMSKVPSCSVMPEKTGFNFR